MSRLLRTSIRKTHQSGQLSTPVCSVERSLDRHGLVRILDEQSGMASAAFGAAGLDQINRRLSIDMKTLRLVLLATVSLLTSLTFGGGSPTPRPASVSVDTNAIGQLPLRASAREAYGKLPLSFEANRGQTDPVVDFVARGSGYTLFLAASEAVLYLRTAAHLPVAHARGESEDMSRRTGSVLRMQLLGAQTAMALASDELPGKVNFFIGNDPSRWRTQIPTYAKIVYPEVYPGIDLVYYGDQGRLEYDFIVKPGADPAAIALSYAGTDEIRLDANGDLVLRLDDEEIRQTRPVAYQDVGGTRQEVTAAYRLGEHGDVGFDVGAYDRSAPLVIDPVLTYSTYLGGAGDDQGFGIAVDSSGSAYVTGVTGSTNFPTLGAFQPTFAGGIDAFVSKLNATGSALVYSTYLGGSDDDEGLGIAVDASGSAYVTGFTGSTNFPTTAGAFQPTLAGGPDAFVTKLNPAGSAPLLYSTYLGGSNIDGGFGIAVDSSGSAYVTGDTASTNFPTLGAFQPTFGTVSCSNPPVCFDAFVTKLNPAGSALVYSSYLGGSDNDEGRGIAVDSSGSAYVTGFTLSTNFPTTGAFQPSLAGRVDAFVTKLNPAGSALVYSTYLGGSAADAAFGIAVDAAGSAYLTGQTDSTNFPTTKRAFQKAHAGGQFDAFVAKILPPSTPLCTVAITVKESGWITAMNGDKANFHGIASSDAQGNASGNESYQDHGPAQPFTMDSTTILAVTCADNRMSATIFGEATIDGSGNHMFQIDVIDRGQNGSNDKYGISIPDIGYASGLQPLQGGNVTIQ